MHDSTQGTTPPVQRTFVTPGVAIALLDPEGTVVAWSRAAERLVGHRAVEVVSRSADALLANSDDRAKLSGFAGHGSVQDAWSGVVTLRHQDGREVGVRLSMSPLSGAEGRTQWMAAANDNVTLPPWAADADTSASLPPPSPFPSRQTTGVVIRDTDLHCIWVNDTQGTMDGVPLTQRIGRTLAEAAPGTDADTLEEQMRHVLESGVPALNVEYRAFLLTQAREERTLAASFFRLDDARGCALGVCIMSVDVTDRRRARERLAILGEAGRRIGTTLDVMRTGQELADMSVPLLADYVSVDLAESVPLGEEPLAHISPQGGRIPAFRRAGVASIHSGAPESLFARGEPVYVPPDSPFTSVLRSGKSHFEPVLDASPGTWLDQFDTARVAKVREHGMRSLMVIPVQARGTVLGVAVFVRAQGRAPFEEDDLLLAEELVSRAALSLDNARRYTRERAAALALQRYLLPHNASAGAAAEVAWRYLPADSHHGVGGDWFDVIPLSGARVALVVGDVVGHGIKAAATMGQLRAAVRTLADLDMPPDELLAHLDQQVIRLAEAAAESRDEAISTMAATCLYAVYDPVTRSCAMARAGHPPPAIIDPHGGVTFLDTPSGAPLGLGGVPFETTTRVLPEGSVLAMYTDGLIEARDDDLDAGMNRLSTVLGRYDLPLDDLCATTVDALSTQRPRDDVTLLLARTHSLSPGQIASWRLVGTPTAAGCARALATRQLQDWGLPHLIEPTKLIVTELITNAIRHAVNGEDSAIGLRLIRHTVLTCEVCDASQSHPRVRHPQATDENGRGLHLVTELSHRWGTRDIPNGKLIWSEQQLSPDR
ncbi:PAS domain S-box protein [Streptomyces sp. me109]|uniref:SpoIIE family protein phosphatase n=1 Tax=Streptomyces sp. me109 TaxID=1827853 RepID=UPI0011CE61A2|nr:SpoIIE family protein phosphatase [Streptomyces sp. me109]TXS70160.1 PAS domain S-box protein [Streptomyces sp. me109]